MWFLFFFDTMARWVQNKWFLTLPANISFLKLERYVLFQKAVSFLFFFLSFEEKGFRAEQGMPSFFFFLLCFLELMMANDEYGCLFSMFWNYCLRVLWYSHFCWGFVASVWQWGGVLHSCNVRTGKVRKCWTENLIFFWEFEIHPLIVVNVSMKQSGGSDLLGAS